MQQQTIPQSKKFANEKQEKQQSINMNLIADTSLDIKQKENLSEEDKIDAIIKLKSIHLQWLSLKKIENLQVFEYLSVLYLQHNNIGKIQGLSHLKNLEYLALNDNKITVVQNIRQLTKLQGLNLNNNEIEQIENDCLPENLTLVSFKNNPVCLDVDYKSVVLKQLKLLESIDDQNITALQRFKLLGKFPQKYVGYANQMKHFYTKRQIQGKITQENKQLLFNTEAIDEKLAIGEIKALTRKFVHINQESFKRDIKQQVQNFNEKIEVSKKIRAIKQNQQKERQKKVDEIKQSTMAQLMQNYAPK